MKLFYIILGAEPEGRNTEQHDVFFGIAETLKDLVPNMISFWPEAKGKIHIDAYQEVKFVEGFEIKILQKTDETQENQLFFINLGGYHPSQFQELHSHFLMAGSSMSEIIKKSKKTEFYKTMGFKDAPSHIDDKFGVAIDDISKVNDILPISMKEKYSVILEKSAAENQENYTFIGYIKLSKIK